MRALLLLLVTSPVIAGETRLIVQSNQPVRVSIGPANRDSYQAIHTFSFNNLPDDTYMDISAVASNLVGERQERQVRLASGEVKQICFTFPAQPPVATIPPVARPDWPQTAPQPIICQRCIEREKPVVCTLCDFWWLLLGAISAFSIFLTFMAFLSYRRWYPACSLRGKPVNAGSGHVQVDR